MSKGHMKDGFYKMTDDDYFSIDALSNSYLKLFDRSPAHAEKGLTPTAAMIAGKIAHAFLLDPKEFDKYVISSHECVNRKCKPYNDLKNENPGKEIILHKDFIDLKNMKKVLLDSEIQPGVKFRNFYDHKNMRKEIAIFYYDPEFEVLLKGKVDMLFYDSETPVIFDPKFTKDASQLEKQINNLKYYRQDAFYSSYLVEKLTGLRPIFYFAGIETESPYGIEFYEITEEYRDRGIYESKMSIEKYVVWKKSGAIMKSSWGGVKKVHKPGYFKD